MNKSVVVLEEPVMVARIRVEVVADGVDVKVKTEPDYLKVPLRSRCLIIWELNDPKKEWVFLGHGISFKDDTEAQFTSLFRSRGGDRVIHFDRNTHKRPYNYTVALTDPKHERVKIDDPIIENEGDG